MRQDNRMTQVARVEMKGDNSEKGEMSNEMSFYKEWDYLNSFLLNN